MPATLSPGGLTRKFWILLAYGALVYREEHLRLEIQALDDEVAATGGEVRGRSAIDRPDPEGRGFVEKASD